MCKGAYLVGWEKGLGVVDGLDVTEALKPGVYVLAWRGRVVYVGRAKCMLAAIADHRSACGRPRLPEWFPIKAIQFDSITIHPLPYSQTLPLAQALIEFHKPSHNLHSGPSEPFPSDPIPLPTAQPSPSITRRL